jgi:hypothetical protein
MNARVAFSLNSCALAGITAKLATKIVAHGKLLPALLMIRGSRIVLALYCCCCFTRTIVPDDHAAK